MFGPFCLNCTVDEVDVEIAVAIVIEKPAAGSEELIEESHTASTVGMHKCYPGGFRNIGENRFCGGEWTILETYQGKDEKAIERRDFIQVSFPHKEKFTASFVAPFSNALNSVMLAERRYRQVRFL